MKTDRVSATQRKTVCIRAEGHYEYCHTPADYVPGSFAIEHIIPKSKGGKTVSSNLALSCPACNAHKYNKLECADPLNQKTCRLFNPRKQRWQDYFTWSADYTLIIGKSPAGRATVEALQMNHEKIVNPRRLMIMAELHPPESDKAVR